MLRFLILFVVILITLFDSNVAAYGKILQSTTNGFGVSIEAGCNGIEAAIVLIAAMLAFPAPWKHRVIGILAGLSAVQVLNIVRVISLFDLLVQVGVKLGPDIAAQAGLFGWRREAIALGYQTGNLIFPSLIPVVLWAGFSRSFIENLLRSQARNTPAPPLTTRAAQDAFWRVRQVWFMPPVFFPTLHRIQSFRNCVGDLQPRRLALYASCNPSRGGLSKRVNP